ncbi:hypothetical protein, partial [Haloarcula nitratireducens]
TTPTGGMASFVADSLSAIYGDTLSSMVIISHLHEETPEETQVRRRAEPRATNDTTLQSLSACNAE